MTKRIDESNAGGIRAALDILNQNLSEADPDEFDYGFDPQAEFDDGDDARIEAFHRGFDAFFAKEPRPSDPDEASGWDYAESASMTHTVEPSRPEGYYHMPLGTFESLDEVRQAGEYDFRKNMTSRKGGVYAGRTDMPGYGRATAKVRYTPARSGDNALAETKGFVDYLKEVEELNEISDETLNSYMAKAKPQAYGYGTPFDEIDPSKGKKRMKGVNKASEIVKDRSNPIEAKIHDMTEYSDGEVYDITQTDDSIKDGDILKLSGGRFAILFKAWPTMVKGDSDILHALADGDWSTVSRGRYMAAIEKIDSLNETTGSDLSESAKEYEDSAEGAKAALADLSIYDMSDIVSAERDDGGVFGDPFEGSWRVTTRTEEYGEQTHIVYLRGPMAGTFGADFETLD